MEETQTDEETEEEKYDGTLSDEPEDPAPPPSDATEAQRAEYKEIIHEYTIDMMNAYKKTTMTGLYLWADFKTAFRPAAIKLWSRSTMTEWAEFLTNRDIHIDHSGRKSRARSLIDVLYRDSHIPSKRADRSLSYNYNGEEDDIVLEESSDDDEAEWAMDDDDEEGYWNFLTDEQGKEIEVQLSEVTFLHGCNSKREDNAPEIKTHGNDCEQTSDIQTDHSHTKNDFDEAHDTTNDSKTTPNTEGINDSHYHTNTDTYNRESNTKIT